MCAHSVLTVANGTGRPSRPPPDSPVSLTSAPPRHGPRRSTSDAARAAAAASAGSAGGHQSHNKIDKPKLVQRGSYM